MSSLHMHHQHHAGATVIALAGEIDLASAPQLQQFIRRVRQTPADQLIFDMAEVKFMDSTGLRVLLDAFDVAQRHGGAIHLAALQGPPARLMEITRLDERFCLHSSTDSALAAVLAHPPGRVGTAHLGRAHPADPGARHRNDLKHP
ncbi:STAS domain-containing protein [Nonomuraea sp. SYSU D8015]|uniref:STAS domain-containing protein n=1 Tax=Nonomuraea sp. SYSU D8015 TaxID=2593644 RepID=UPI001CB6F4B9